MKPRSVDDPRVVEVLAAFDASARKVAYSRDSVATLVRCFMDDVLGFPWEKWPVAAYRAVLVASLVSAPSADLDEMLVAAREHLRWRAGFALDREYEGRGLGACYSDELKAWAKRRDDLEAVRS